MTTIQASNAALAHKGSAASRTRNKGRRYVSSCGYSCRLFSDDESRACPHCGDTMQVPRHRDDFGFASLGKRKKFACPRCAFSCRLFAEHDSRNCPRCDTLMMLPLATPAKEPKADAKHGNPETVPMRDWYRCDDESGCGGMHWAGETCPLE